jgi:foldase protein PrsA
MITTRIRMVLDSTVWRPSLVAVVSLSAAVPVLGQTREGRNANTPPPAPTALPSPSGPTDTTTPKLKPVAIPVNPSDPVAVINGQVITRQMLSDECVARRGVEILETLIARVLIDQAIQAQGLSVTAEEINAEIDSVAQRMAGLSREAWLKTLYKERGISPEQYARDIIYPTLALRKLAEPLVQITPKDLQIAFDATYGDKLRCRMIMVDKLRVAQEIWQELKANPGGFEKIAMERSMDLNTRSLGGLIAEPISRHAAPETVSAAAFAQLVDGNPNDKDPSHKPKDGDITGPIQVSETSWIILKREAVIPAQAKDPNDPAIAAQLEELVRDTKIKEKMGEVFNALMKRAQIENRLTGHIKMANEDPDPAAGVDAAIRRASNNDQEQSAPPQTAPAPKTITPPPVADGPGAQSPKLKLPVPAGVTPEMIRERERLREQIRKEAQSVKPSNN